MKSIYFPAPVADDMVRAILEGRKTVMRRVVKGYALDHMQFDTDGSITGVYNQDEGHVFPIMDYAPYRPGDILYVRETWAELETVYGVPYYAYKADDDTLHYSIGENFNRWYPSIYMPREAARIFLRVTDVRVERLQDISSDEIDREGIDLTDLQGLGCITRGEYVYAFQSLWCSTIKKADRDLYGWDANPWIWVIEFERCERPSE